MLMALCLLAAAPAAQGESLVCPGITPSSPPDFSSDPGTCTSFSVSLTSSQSIQTTQVNQQVDQFMTQITAHLFGGPLVYDQTFNLAYSDPLLADAVMAAQLALQGLAFPLTFIGPNLVSSRFRWEFIQYCDRQPVRQSIRWVDQHHRTEQHPGRRSWSLRWNKYHGTRRGFPFGCTPGREHRLS